jgi:hypothetical protein
MNEIWERVLANSFSGIHKSKIICSVAQIRVHRGSDSSASACSSSNLIGGLLPSGSNEDNKSSTLRVVYSI